MTYVVMVPVIIGLSTLYARRLHDIGASHSWLLLLLIPVVAPVLGLSLIFLQGESGPNRYGPPPSADFDVRALLFDAREMQPANRHDLKTSNS
jgi:uncharacterized membrane protein YhaH (DUF805 family)